MTDQNNAIKVVRFTERDLELFAELSMDRNPLHTDPDYARKTAYGQRVCYGIMSAMTLLIELKGESLSNISSLKIDFMNVVFIDVDYRISIEAEGKDKCILRLLDGQITLLELEAVFGEKHNLEPEKNTPNALNGFKYAKTAKRLDLIDIQEVRNVEGTYSSVNIVEESAVSGWLKLKSYSPFHFDVLLLSSYLVGMELPGEKALFSGLRLNFSNCSAYTANKLKFYCSTEHFDESYGLLNLRLSVQSPEGCVAEGDIDSFVRNEFNAASAVSIEPESPTIRRAFSGKAALITGGSRGLGAAICRILANHGCHVFLNYHRSRDEAQALERLLKDREGRISLIEGDIGSPEMCEKALAEIMETAGRLDYLFCNANLPATPLGFTGASFRRIQDYIEKNLALTSAPMLVFLEQLSAFQGTAVGISSVFVSDPPKNLPQYVGAKMAMEGFIMSAAKTHSDVRFCIVRPPRLKTDMNNTPLGLLGAIEPQQAAGEILERISATERRPGVEIIENLSGQHISPHSGASEPSQMQEQPGEVDRILISASFTAESLLAGLAFWNEELGLNFEAKNLAYNQIFQELLNPEGLFLSNSMGMNVVMLRFEDWITLQEPESGSPHLSAPDSDEFLEMKKKLGSILDDFIAALQTCQSRAAVNTSLLICPSSAEYRTSEHWAALFEELEATLFEKAGMIESLFVQKAEQLHISYQVDEEEIDDRVRNEIAHIPYTEKYYDFLSALIVRNYYRSRSKEYKVIVLDCDQTLWRGVCGEVSHQEISIQEGFDEFQRFLVRQKDQGMLLCLCSKNIEDDVWNVFNNRPDFPLKKEHLVDYRINWKQKSENLRSLADTLNVGLDSFIFIDDNPVEIAEVRANAPEVLALEWPKDAMSRKNFIHHNWLFDHLSATREDGNRTLMMQLNLKRQSAMEQSVDFEDFLQKLDLKIDIAIVAKEDLSRVAQLTKRTNQFNLTTIRRSRHEIQNLLEAENYEGLVVNVKDRFGEYGLVGVMIFRQETAALNLDSFLLSCRVLGRGVEYAMLAELGRLAVQRNLMNVLVTYLETEKNKPAIKFLTDVNDQISGQKTPSANDKKTSFLFDAKLLSGVRFVPASYHETPSMAKKVKSQGFESFARAEEMKFEKITRSLSNISLISQSIRSSSDISKDWETANGDSGIPAKQKSHSNILDEVVKIFATSLSIKPDSIDTRANLETYVNKSIKIVQLTVELKKHFPHIPPTFLFEHSSLDDIAQELTGRTPPSASPAVLRKASSAISSIPESLDAKKINGEKSELVVNGSGANEFAIIGVNGKYPGAENLEQFWANIVNGVSSIREIPDNRWEVSAFFDPSGESRDKSYSKWGGFLERIEYFENSFFHISPREAEYMDPQQRIFLEIVWGLLEDACYTTESLASDTGVFVGVISNDYGMHINQASLIGKSSYRWADPYQIPNRISYFLNLNGPSMAIDTACSSSGTAIHLACESMKRGECSSAIVGGVNLILHPSRFIQYSRMQIISRDGKCSPFGAKANGTVLGEGIGALLLKPLRQAVEDQDNIYGVIKGTAINSGGKTNGFTVPNPAAHTDLISKALANASVSPGTIGYIEAHGTGTSLGDPIEVRGLAKAFENESSSSNNGTGPKETDTQFCGLGSVKSNIGHLESAAAIAGVIKVLYQMRYKTLVPSLNSAETNPMIQFESSPFFVPQEPREWKQPVVTDRFGTEHISPRRAGVSSFGAGGSNAHIILEEFEIPESKRSVREQGAVIIVLSAKTSEALEIRARLLKDFVEMHISSDELLQRIAYNLQVGREQMECRMAMICESIKELSEKLGDYLKSGASSRDLFTGKAGSDMSQTLNFGNTKLNQKFIRQLSESGEHRKIAALWTLGAKLDWSSLYPANERPSRMSLPTYPFAGFPHWLPAKTTRNQAGNSGYHRFLGEQIRSPFIDGSLYRTTFSLNDLAYLNDHQIYSTVVVPGSLYVSYALQAAVREFGGDYHCFKNLVFVKAITLDENISYDIHFQLQKERDHIFELELASRSESVKDSEGDWQTHFTGIYQRELSGRQSEAVNFTEIKERVSVSIDPEQFYEESRRIGFNWGARFQCIEALFRNKGEALGLICLPDELGEEMEYHEIHPAFLDACFQVFVAGMEEDGMHKEASKAYLPLGIDEAIFYDKIPIKIWSYVRVVSNKHLESFVVDILLFDDSGRVFARFNRLRVLRANKESLRASGVENNEKWLHELVWTPDTRQTPHKIESGESINENEFWLLLADDYSSGKQLSLEFYEQNVNHRLVSHNGTAEQSLMDEDRPDFNPNSRLMSFLNNNADIKWEDCSGIVYMMDPFPEDRPTTLHLLYEGLERCTKIILTLIRALSKQYKNLPGLYLVSGNAQPMSVEETGDNLLGNALWGLARVVALEHPEIWGGIIDLPARAQQEHFRALAEELLFPSAEDQIVIRDKRYVARLRRTAKPLPVRGDFSIKPESAYLITGAFGSIGFQTVKWFIEQGAKSLALVSRNEPGTEIKEALDEFRRKGAEIHVFNVDISNQADVNAMFKEMAGFQYPLAGIIHAAGVLEDGVLINQDWERFRKVMAPKVAGSWNLHVNSQSIPLEFFIMFSSASSLLGAPGQGNYALANAFLDALAHYRHSLSLPALSINWGPWEGSGMASRNTRKSSQQSWTTESFGSISSREGLNILGDLMKIDAPQIGVLPYQWDKLIERFPTSSLPSIFKSFEGLRANGPVNGAKNKRFPGPAKEENFLAQMKFLSLAEQKSKLKDVLFNNLAGILGYSNPEKINEQASFQEMGFDSLMAVNFRTQLCNALKINLPATVIFDYPNIHLLMEFLLEEALEQNLEVVKELREPQEAKFVNSIPVFMKSAESEFEENLDSLSEQEVECLILDELESIKMN